MGRLFQVNDQVLLDVTQKSGRGQPPIVISCICVESEPYRVVLSPKFDDIQVDIGRGGVRNLFDYYSGLRPPPPPPGTVVIQRPPDKTTFDNLEQFATDPASFKDDIQRALTSVAAERRPDRADRLVFTLDGLHEGQIVVHRLYCIVEIDLYVAVDLSSLMDPDDYDDFIDSVTQELRQTGRTYASQEAPIRRGERPTRDFPIVRRAGLERYIAYLKVGIGTFVFQSGWDVDDSCKLCAKEDRPRITEPAFQPTYETVPRRPDEPEELRKPEFQEPEPEQALRSACWQA